MSQATLSYHFPDALGHTPSESASHRAVSDRVSSKLISGLLAACELLQYDIFETHGVSLRIAPAGQLFVLQVSENSIAATHGSAPSLDDTTTSIIAFAIVFSCDKNDQQLIDLFATSVEHYIDSLRRYLHRRCRCSSGKSCFCRRS